MNLKDKILFLRDSVFAEETAAEQFLGDYDASDARDVQIAYYMLSLQRANALLDRKREDIFQQVLDLTNRGQVEKARLAYSKDYLFSLGLSLEATSELAKELIQLAKTYRLPATQDWEDVARFNSGPQVQPESNTYPRKLVDL